MYNAVRQAYLAQKSLFRSPRLGTYLPKIRTIAQEDFRKCVGVRFAPALCRRAFSTREGVRLAADAMRSSSILRQEGVSRR
jgi:hypothetical protein